MNNSALQRLVFLIALILATSTLGVLLGGLILGKWLGVPIVSGAALTQYDMFNDLLNILLILFALFLGFLGMVAYGIYRILRRELAQEAQASAEKAMTRTMARLYAGMGWSYWQRYEQTKDDAYLQLAIDMTHRALTIHAPRLDQRAPMDEEIICDIRNDIAWYLAQRGKPEDKELALACIEYLRQRMTKYEKHRKAWEDTCRFVVEKYP